MKIYRFLLCAAAVLMVFSCEKEPGNVTPIPTEEEKNQEKEPWKDDFEARYPEATVSGTEAKVGAIWISFVDKDGYDNTAVYNSDKWLMTQKTYCIDTDGVGFYKVAPREVRYAFTVSDLGGYADRYEYLIEITRNGMDRKQYEILCWFHDSSYHLYITEEGTLLSLYEVYAASIDHGDMRKSIALVREMYKDAELLGSANDNHCNDIFIRDKDGILKTVKTKEIQTSFGLRPDFEWVETFYDIPRDTPLPESVKYRVETFFSPNFDRLQFVERPDGTYYRAFWGGHRSYTSVLFKVEES